MNARSDLYWSVRRELWEHRSVWVAPLVVAGIALLSFLVSLAGLPQKMRALAALDPVKQANALAMPYSMAASVILLAGWVIGAVFAADALNGERRDRSILFWKSMPVSDLTTVASKAAIPLVVLPLYSCAVALATQALMLLAASAVLSASGAGAGSLWGALSPGTMTLVMLYGMAIHALWFAPIYGWLLLVSAWARRAVFLWAALPFVAIFIVERLALGTSWIASALQYRLLGAMTEGFAINALKTPTSSLAQLDPQRFLSSPNVWLGLAFAVGCLALAVRVRRYREPN
jgi:ABC-2 type transport system permease protein